MEKFIGKKCLVRGDRSGVFYGTVESINGQNVVIKNARGIYYWSGANALSELAVNGTQNPNDCKFTVVVETIGILDCVEIIPCTKDAIKNIESVKVWAKK